MVRKGKDSKRASQPTGRYANYFEVGYNAFEFVLNFGLFYSESKQAQLHTKIITGPAYAKALLETLQRSIDQYEQTFGTTRENRDKEISIPDEGNS